MNFEPDKVRKQMNKDAVDMNKAIKDIEASYLQKFNNLKEEYDAKTITLPFPGHQYDAVIFNGYIYVKGWNGDLVTNKLLIGSDLDDEDSRIYGFINPIVQKDVTIWGLVKYENDVQQLCLNAPILFHGLYTITCPTGIHSTCWGGNWNHGRCTFEEFKQHCKDAAESQSIITTMELMHTHDIVVPKIGHPNRDAIQFIKEYGNTINGYEDDFNKYFKPLM